MLQVELGSHKYLKVKKDLKESVYNGYRSEKREKQGIVVYRQTVTSLRFVSLLFRAHDLLKMANINPQQKKNQIFTKEKISSCKHVSIEVLFCHRQDKTLTKALYHAVS